MATIADAAPGRLNRRLLFTLTAATALAVGNVYYCQPLLGEITRTFSRSAASAGAIPMLNQLGYVIGLIFLTPLGDVVDKRRFLVGLLGLAAVALLGAGLAPSFHAFLGASLAVGLSSTLVQVLIPFVAVLSSPAERGKNLGTILSAALIGVLISRTLSGFVGARLGWRGMYFCAAATMAALAVALRFGLPRSASSARLPYPRLLASVWALFRDLPELRAIAITGALMYAALSAFWASLAFYLQSEVFHAGPDAAGLFGLVGAVGALAANVTGRNVERLGARWIVQACIGVMLAGYAVFAVFGASWVGLVAGVVLLDLGAQAATVSNQTEIYRLYPEAQTRLNTIYKILYFAGGACGSALSAFAWDKLAWRGVCAVGVGFLALAFAWERLQASKGTMAAVTASPRLHP